MIRVNIEPTPNPATMTFRFSEKLLDSSTEFLTPAQAEQSPLAIKIFGFPWTSAVYLGPDFVSVTKQDWVDWEVLSEPLAGLIQEHLDQNEPLMIETQAVGSNEDDIQDSDSEIVKEIKRILDREIRPVVALDGGDIRFGQFSEGILSLKMKGACAGCPSSQATLKDGIEVRMKELFPDIKEVVAQ